VIADGRFECNEQCRRINGWVRLLEKAVWEKREDEDGRDDESHFWSAVAPRRFGIRTLERGITKATPGRRTPKLWHVAHRHLEHAIGATRQCQKGGILA
jgi:hypothetical protein